MTIVSITAVHMKPGASWDAMQAQLKKANDLARKHGAENVTVMVGMAAGPATGTLTILNTSEDWTSYGKAQDALMADPEMRALMGDPNSPFASWDTYLSQAIADL